MDLAASLRMETLGGWCLVLHGYTPHSILSTDSLEDKSNMVVGRGYNDSGTNGEVSLCA